MDRKVRAKTENKQRHQRRKTKAFWPSEERKIMLSLRGIVPKQQPQTGLSKKKLILQKLRQIRTHSSGLRNTKNNKAKHQAHNQLHHHKRRRTNNWFRLWISPKQQHKSISQTSTFITHLQTSSNKQQYDQHKKLQNTKLQQTLQLQTTNICPNVPSKQTPTNRRNEMPKKH